MGIRSFFKKNKDSTKGFDKRSSTRHKYEYIVNMNENSAPALVLKLVGTNKKVLEVGSGPGSISKLLKNNNKCHVTALDNDPEAIKIVSKYCDEAILLDLNTDEAESYFKNSSFDVVIAADVLEHLYDPLKTLLSIKGLLKDAESFAVISLPHVGHASLIACLLCSDFEYRDWGLLDRTHIRFFGLNNIEKMIAEAGMKIVATEFVIKDPNDTEFSQVWDGLNDSVKKNVLENKYSRIYQVVMKVAPFESSGVPISLMNIDIL